MSNRFFKTSFFSKKSAKNSHLSLHQQSLNKIAKEFLNATKLTQNNNDQTLNLFKQKLALAYAELSINFRNYFIDLLPKFSINTQKDFVNPCYHKLEQLKNDEIIELHIDSDLKHIYFVLSTVILKSFLQKQAYIPFFTENIQNLEIIIAKYFNQIYTKPETLNNDDEINPIFRFAEVNSLFFTTPELIEKEAPELYNLFNNFWKSDHESFFKNISNSYDVKNQQFNPKLHFIYKFTIISIFISSTLMLMLTQITLITTIQIILLVFVPALITTLLQNLFKKMNIPIINGLYTLFCLFGVGVNFCLILLATNYLTLKSNKTKTYFFESKSPNIIEQFDYRYINNEEFVFKARLKFNNELTRTLEFTSLRNKNNNFIVYTKKGILGKEVITKKSAY